MSEYFSADTADLDRFVETSSADVSLFADTHEALLAGRSYLAGLPLNGFVEHSALDRHRELVEFMGENGRFVSEVSAALKDYGDHVGNGVYRAGEDVINAELAKTDAARLEQLERGLVERGMDPAEAAKVRAEVDAALNANPVMSFGEATLAGVAAYQGATVAEVERARRAFDLYPADVAVVVEQNFDVVAGGRGNRDQITLADLHEVIEDESVSEQVRDVAFRLAADQVLFNNMDVAKQTDLSAEPFGNGFNLAEVDGIIGRDDVAQFREKNYQARILSAWHPLVETAGQGYDLTRVDSHAGADDVAAFVEDGDIPTYVRLALFDVYAERFGLDLAKRETLEQELAFAPDVHGLVAGGASYLDVSGQPAGGRMPGVSLTGRQAEIVARPTPSVSSQGGAARGGGGGAGLAVAVYAHLLVESAGFGWSQGRQARIAREGNPQFVHTDPITGRETSLDPSELADLTPAQAKAYVAYFAANGTAPPTTSETIEPHPYLDVTGQWRMSDTNEPVHNVEPGSGEPAASQPESPHHYYDSQGNLRWTDTNQLVELFPVRPHYQDDDGTWRWSDTGQPVEELGEGSSIDETGPSPVMGFRTVAEFMDFGDGLHQEFANIGVEDASFYLQGSAVTNRRHDDGSAFSTTESDFDVLIVSDILAAQALERGLEFRGDGTSRPIDGARFSNQAGITEPRSAMSRRVDRDINFQIISRTDFAAKEGGQGVFIPKRT